MEYPPHPGHYPVIHAAGFPEQFHLLSVLVRPLEIERPVTQHIVTGCPEFPEGQQPLGRIFPVKAQGFIVNGVPGDHFRHIVLIPMELLIHSQFLGIVGQLIEDQLDAVLLRYIQNGGTVRTPGCNPHKVPYQHRIADQHLAQTDLIHILQQSVYSCLIEHGLISPLHD